MYLNRFEITVSRRRYSSAFKTKVALAALKKRETLAELSACFELPQEMISRWKGECIRLSEGVFDNKVSIRAREPSIEVKVLRDKVAELTTERYFYSACLQKERSKSVLIRLVSRINRMSISKQCAVLKVSRSQLYYEPKQDSTDNLKV